MSAVEAVVLIAVGTAAAIAWAMFSNTKQKNSSSAVSGEASRAGYKERGRPEPGRWRASANDQNSQHPATGRPDYASPTERMELGRDTDRCRRPRTMARGVGGCSP